MKKEKPDNHSKPSFLKRLRRFVRNVILLFFIISIGWVALARFVPVWLTPLMCIRYVEAVSGGKTPQIRKKWVPIEKISPDMVQAVVAAEDDLFMQHRGFSINAINKAIEHNKKGKRVRGGSTISQQTAKNVFLWPQRSYVRKAFEAYFTVLIEFFWTKERIMEVYLNVIETGDGVYGVEAAAQTFFGKSADKLTRSQCARIAVCLPNPRRFKVDKPSPYIQRREAQIVNLMGKIGKVDLNKKTDKKDSN
jgi:monofunctional biosynthetic peptidoglycan transglycosylase